MKDIPMFATEFGVASLILKEIPYRDCAYILVQSSLEPEKLLEECVGFCRACGAERIYAAGEEIPEKYPFFTAEWELHCPVAALGETDAAVFPVQAETLELWREIYNEKVASVPMGAWMTRRDGEEMLKKGDGYFVHRNGTLLGIGRASGERIDWVAAVQCGAGKDVVRALHHCLFEDTAVLTVASENHRAFCLYTRLGFVRTRELRRWFRVYGDEEM